MDLKFEVPTIEDLPELTGVMTRAFDDDARKHLGEEKGGPPGYDNGDFYRKWLFEKKNTEGVMALADGKIVGAAIVWLYPNGDNYLGNICVDPEYQDRGVGSRIWKYLENTYSTGKSWTLHTPGYAVKNHHFYTKKCGFTKVEEKPDDCPGGVSFVFKKTVG